MKLWQTYRDCSDFSSDDLVDPSYYEMMLNRDVSTFENTIVGFYYRTQNMTFGVVSGVLTVTGHFKTDHLWALQN